jgi:hypothetical protein
VSSVSPGQKAFSNQPSAFANLLALAELIADGSGVTADTQRASEMRMISPLQRWVHGDD